MKTVGKAAGGGRAEVAHGRCIGGSQRLVQEFSTRFCP